VLPAADQSGPRVLPLTRITVVSVPAGHDYVRHLDPVQPLPGVPVVVRPPDPDPDDPSRPATGRWWPPVALDPTWVRRRTGPDADPALDVLHVHFGFDDRSPAELTALVDALEEAGTPLVLTVHDLRSPHQDDPAVLDAQLDVLVPAAAGLVTLTPGAAATVRTRWGRDPLVLPHPHVVALDRIDDLRAGRSAPGARPPRIGVAVKSLRTNTDPLRLLPSLVEATRELGGTLVAAIHRATYADPPTERAATLVRALDAAAAAGDLELLVHEPMDDEELWSFLAGLDVAVLPYTHGTHSGWLEACHDVGTSVVAPSFGHYADQPAEATYAATRDAVDGPSLVAAVTTAARARAVPGAPLPGLDASARRRQRDEVALAHARLYEAVLTGRTTP